MTFERYHRHMLLPEIGRAGQEKLSAAKVAVVGMGGLGSPAVQYLAAAGAGQLTLIDGDRVHISNLPRQILFNETHIGQNKALAAAERLFEQNPEVRCIAYDTYLTPENAVELLTGHDLVIDGSDNFPTRYLINDVCMGLDIPFIFGALDRFQAQVMLCNLNGGSDYRCLFPHMPEPDTAPSCAETGMLNTVAGLAALTQAHLALLYLSGMEVPAGQLWLADLRTLSTTLISIPMRKDQRRIARHNFQRLPDVSYDFTCDAQLEWTIEELEQRIKNVEIIDIRENVQPPLPWPSRSVPVSTLSENRLPRDQDIVLVCRYGTASRRMARWLRDCGMQRVYSLHGGIHAIARLLQPTEIR